MTMTDFFEVDEKQKTVKILNLDDFYVIFTNLENRESGGEPYLEVSEILLELTENTPNPTKHNISAAGRQEKSCYSQLDETTYRRNPPTSPFCHWFLASFSNISCSTD